MTKAQNCTPAADYRTDAPRADGWTYERQATFLMALAETGLVTSACKIAEMSPASAYSLRRESRGAAFHLGWQAAHLLARDRLEDILLEAAIAGVETITTRVEKTTIRQVLSGNLSMAVLNRLDRRAASLDDRAMAAARSISAAFEDFISLVMSGGSNAEIAAFLAEHPDPLAAQVETHESSLRAKRGNPVAMAGLDCRASLAMTPNETLTKAPQLIEKSAIFIAPPAHSPSTFDPIAAHSPSALPCDCHADRDLALLEAV